MAGATPQARGSPKGVIVTDESQHNAWAAHHYLKVAHDDDEGIPPLEQRKNHVEFLIRAIRDPKSHVRESDPPFAQAMDRLCKLWEETKARHPQSQQT